jgi:succinyl-diaminopimelate desuccinylase
MIDAGAVSDDPQMPSDLAEALFKSIDERRSELVELTRALIGFPTVNPPGEGYQACAEFIGRRLQARGFALDYVRAEGTPGDCDRYPRLGRTVRAFQRPYRCRAGRCGLDRGSVCRRDEGR